MSLVELDARLKSQKNNALTRHLEAKQSIDEAKVLVDGRVLIDFSSNDYLGLRHHAKIKAAFIEGIARFGVGSGASSVVSGYHTSQEKVLSAFARYLSQEAALLFPTGYMANLAVVSTLFAKETAIFLDKFSHASIYDGIKLSQGVFYRYHHCDHVHLNRLLAKKSKLNKVIMTESIFSMTGKKTPLPLLLSLAKKHHASIVIDDAHGLGLLGEKGISAGAYAKDIDVIICPLGKAFASFGAVVAGKKIWIEGLKQFARSFLYSTALPPAHAHALLTTLAIIREADDKRAYLQNNINVFKALRKKTTFHWSDSDSAIQYLITGDNKKALYISQQLNKKGFLVIPMRSPTVPRQLTGLRIVLSAIHSAQMINALFIALNDMEGIL